MSRRDARETALRILFGLGVNPISSFEETLSDYEGIHGKLRGETREYALAVIGGVVKNLSELDSALAAASEHWRIDRMGQVERTVLRIGAFEIMKSPEVPNEVAINEAIEMTKKYSNPDAAGFVNGVLDGLLHSEASRA